MSWASVSTNILFLQSLLWQDRAASLQHFLRRVASGWAYMPFHSRFKGSAYLLLPMSYRLILSRSKNSLVILLEFYKNVTASSKKCKYLHILCLFHLLRAPWWKVHIFFLKSLTLAQSFLRIFLFVNRIIFITSYSYTTLFSFPIS